jgi:hypothetical protein
MAWSLRGRRAYLTELFDLFPKGVDPGRSSDDNLDAATYRVCGPSIDAVHPRQVAR